MSDPILVLLRSIQETVTRVEAKVDHVSTEGCAKRNGDLQQIKSNSFWIRIGLIGLISLLISVVVGKFING